MIGLKRSHDSSSTPSPTSKKQKLHNSVATSSKRSSSPHTTLTDRSASPVVRSGTPSDGGHSITEEAIRRYLTHKPMTTTDIMKKFKTKKTGLTKEQTVNAIAAILKKIQPHQEKIDGKLYLSIKTKKWKVNELWFWWNQRMIVRQWGSQISTEMLIELIDLKVTINELSKKVNLSLRKVQIFIVTSDFYDFTGNGFMC